MGCYKIYKEKNSSCKLQNSPTAPGLMEKYWICWNRFQQFCILNEHGPTRKWALCNHGNHKESSWIVLNRFPEDGRRREPPVKQGNWESLGQRGKRNYKRRAHENNTERKRRCIEQHCSGISVKMEEFTGELITSDWIRPNFNFSILFWKSINLKDVNVLKSKNRVQGC